MLVRNERLTSLYSELKKKELGKSANISYVVLSTSYPTADDKLVYFITGKQGTKLNRRFDLYSSCNAC